jgi:hypothetical protein
MFTSAVSGDRELKKVLEFARASSSLALTSCLVDFGWRCVNPMGQGALAELFSGYSSLERNFFWWHKDKGLLVVWDDVDDAEQTSTMGIGVLACPLENLPGLLMDVRHLAAEQGKTSVFWVAPAHAQVETALKQAGFSSDWNHPACVFEKNHPQDAK